MGSICAVVIPIYRKLKPSELLSLRIGQTVLSRHSIFIVLPSSLDFHSSHFKLIRLPDDRLASIKNYACLMVDKSFYKLFADFEYILIYQLDCLVFADRLVEFCSLGLDYIAPLILGRSDGFWPSNDIVGVGGFSLRKVSSLLRILELIEQPQYKNEAMSLAGRIDRNGAEDMFWSLAAPAMDQDFSVASSEVALAFGYEGNPQLSHIRSNGRQPFGCHHWNNTLSLIWYLKWIWKLPAYRSFSADRTLLIFMALIELLIQDAKKLFFRALGRLKRIQGISTNTHP